MSREVSRTVQGSMSASGLTLIELMVTLAVVVILALTAVPAYQSMIAKQRFAAAVEAVHSQLNLAKSEAAKRSQLIYLAVKTGADWQIAIGDSDTCADDAIANCTLTYYDADGTPLGDPRPFLISSGDFPGAAMTTPSSDITIRIEPVRGTVTNDDGTAATDLEIDLASDEEDYLTRVYLSETGRLEVCFPENDNPDSREPLGRFGDACL